MGAYVAHESTVIAGAFALITLFRVAHYPSESIANKKKKTKPDFFFWGGNQADCFFFFLRTKKKPRMVANVLARWALRAWGAAILCAGTGGAALYALVCREVGRRFRVFDFLFCGALAGSVVAVGPLYLYVALGRALCVSLFRRCVCEPIRFLCFRDSL